MNGACFTQALMDNLTYTHTSGTNKISSISDAAMSTQGGFRAASGAFTYDANGNMLTNGAKGITSISYNHLNLPTNITITGGKTIDFTYAADGTKLRKVVKTGATINLVMEYVNGVEYRGTAIPATTLEAVYFSEGRMYSSSGTWKREYVIKDHLGNTRIAYCDINGDGVIAVAGEILQENNYDAFGYGLDGVYMNHANADNLYQYNGKELNGDHGLNMYDYGARWYDAGVGRFTSIDRFADKYSSMNPYQYGANNPIKYIDVNGDSIGVNITPGGGVNGKDRYDFTVTGKVVDDTRGGLSPRRLENLRKQIVQGIQKSFTGSDENVEYNVTTNITVASSESDLTSSDHAFRIVDDIKGSGETGDDPNVIVAGSTPAYQNVVFLNAKSPGNLSRTAAHELGHSAGLGHIKDSYQSSNGQFKRLTVNDYPSNLMHQSRDVLNPGNRLSSFQVRHIGVLFQAGKLNKGNQK